MFVFEKKDRSKFENPFVMELILGVFIVHKTQYNLNFLFSLESF